MTTGRSDLRNQLNNSLVFPGMFRGVLDVRARTISERRVIAAAEELVAVAREKGLAADRLLPTMDDWRVAVRIAGAAGQAASTEGIAANPLPRSEIERLALEAITASRACVEQLVITGLIPTAFGSEQSDQGSSGR